MSNRAMTWAWDQPIKTPGAKFVLVALADHASDHAGEDWTCYPSVERLMMFTAQSRATVERHLSALVAGGWISRRRRKSKDGRLGVYDYVLHRERKVIEDLNEAASDPADHAANCGMDHASKCGSAMRQNEGQPCLNLTHLYKDEPPIEPSEEPSSRARAGEADWREAFWAGWPDAAKRYSSRRLTFAALDAEVAAGADPAALLIAQRSYAGDPTAWGSSGLPVAPHTFLAEGRWENFAKVPAGGPGGVVEEARTRFASEPWRAALVAAMGEQWVRSWVDPCDWDEAKRVLDPRLTERGKRLREATPAEVLARFGIQVGKVG